MVGRKGFKNVSVREDTHRRVKTGAAILGVNMDAYLNIVLDKYVGGGRDEDS
jgi:hypothetical protein